jgi:hypothetical protein
VNDTTTIQRYEKIKLKRSTYPGYRRRKKANGKKAVVRTDCTASLSQSSVGYRPHQTADSPWITYNHQSIDYMVSAHAFRNEVGKNAHDDDCRDPYQRTASEQKRGEPGAGTGVAVNHGVVAKVYYDPVEIGCGGRECYDNRWKGNEDNALD